MTDTAVREAPPVLVLPPNWYAAVMGTGIIAVAGAVLRDDAGLGGPVRAVVDLALTAVWLAAAALLAVLSAVLLRAARRARAHLGDLLLDPAVAPFHGAIPMAMLTVGAGTLLLGGDVHLPAAVAIDAGLWVAGTVLGVAGAVALTVRAARLGWLGADAAWGGWLMPVVAPMVSAATGALLLPHIGNPALRTALHAVCAALALGSGAAAALVIVAMARRVRRHGRTELGLGHARTAPTLCIPLGPLGQGATAALGLGAPTAVGAAALLGAGAWAVFAVSANRRAVLGPDGLPFSLGWWAFVFPVGTCVTGTAALAHRLDAPTLLAVAGAGYLGLVAIWARVAIRTLRGAADGSLIPLAAQPQAAGRRRRLAW